MIKRVVILFALFGSLVAGTPLVNHLERNGAHLIYTSQSNYSMTSPNFAENNWTTLSVNNDNVTIWMPECESTEKSMKSLSDEEKTLIFKVKHLILIRQKVDDDKSQVFSGVDLTQSGINNNNDDQFLLTKSGLPNNLASVYSNHQVVAFIYLDGRVQMKPISCLNSDEQQLLKKIKLEQQRVSIELNKNMQTIEQNMQYVQQDLDRVFSNGFPFNIGLGNVY